MNTAEDIGRIEERDAAYARGAVSDGRVYEHVGFVGFVFADCPVCDFCEGSKPGVENESQLPAILEAAKRHAAETGHEGIHIDVRIDAEYRPSAEVST